MEDKSSTTMNCRDFIQDESSTGFFEISIYFKGGGVDASAFLRVSFIIL